MLTETTTRQDYADHLKAEYERSRPYGGNAAILAHYNKVADMDEDQWEIHRTRLLEMMGAPLVQKRVKEMAKEMWENIVLGN